MALSASTKARYWDYFILCARVALAFIFMAYGIVKLAGYQFGVTPEVLVQPLKQVSVAHVAWYCFGFQPFSAFVGISQVLASLLLLWNRTVLLGAVLLLPIAVMIFVIDITYLNEVVAFRYALPFYLGLIFLILAHYRDRMRVVFQALAVGVTTRFTHPRWKYLILPVAGVLLSQSWLLPKYTVDFIQNPAGMIRYFDLLFTHLKQLIS
jgi:uncharacterized membrane protein YphA (DoxX/SURF4 family)